SSMPVSARRRAVAASRRARCSASVWALEEVMAHTWGARAGLHQLHPVSFRRTFQNGPLHPTTVERSRLQWAESCLTIDQSLTRRFRLMISALEIGFALSALSLVIGY